MAKQITPDLSIRLDLIKRTKKKIENGNINFGFNDQPFPIELSELYTYNYIERFYYFKRFKNIHDITELAEDDFHKKFPELIFQRLLRSNISDHVNCLKSILYFLNEDRRKKFENFEVAQNEISKKYLPLIEKGLFELLVCMLMQNIEILTTVQKVSPPNVKLYCSVCNLSCAIVLQFLFFVSSCYNVSEKSKNLVNGFIENDEKGKYLLDKVIDLNISFSQDHSNNLAKIHIKKFVILLRVLLIKTLGTYSDAKGLRQTSKKLYNLPAQDYKDSYPIKQNTEESWPKSSKIKIRRYELEYNLYTMFNQICHVRPRCVSLDVKYDCFGDYRWQAFTELKKYSYISLQEAQCDSWANFINYPLSSKLPPMPPSVKITDFFKKFLSNPKFTCFLRFALHYTIPRDDVKAETFFEMEEFTNPAFAKANMSDSEIENPRYKEILAKNILQIIFHLIEHLKSNHVYQLFAFLQHLNLTKTEGTIISVLYSKLVKKLNESNDNSYTALFGSLLVKYTPDPKDYPEDMAPYQPTSTRKVLTSIFLIRILINITKFNKIIPPAITTESDAKFYYKFLSYNSPYIRQIVCKLIIVLLRAYPPKSTKLKKALVSKIAIYRSAPFYIQHVFAPSGDLEMSPSDLNIYDIFNEDIMNKMKKFFRAIIFNKISYNPLNSVFWIRESIKISQKEKDRASLEQISSIQNQNLQSTN